jgi:hypothetical protein
MNAGGSVARILFSSPRQPVFPRPGGVTDQYLWNKRCARLSLFPERTVKPRGLRFVGETTT